MPSMILQLFQEGVLKGELTILQYCPLRSWLCKLMQRTFAGVMKINKGVLRTLDKTVWVHYLFINQFVS